MSETLQFKYKSNIWKDKLRASQKSHKYLHKSCARLKLRLLDQKQVIKKQKKQIYTLLKECETAATNINLSVKPKRHKYSLTIILVCIHFQAMLGLSFRQVQQVIKRFISIAQLCITTPSASSIRNWVRKAAYHRLCQPLQQPTEDSILLIDESACIGQEKVLLILRLQAEQLAAGVPVTIDKVKVISVKSGTSWNGERIFEQLKEAIKRIGGSVKYIISDRCSTLRKAFHLGGYPYVNDCTHLMASCLEHFYKKQDGFIHLMGCLGKIRQQWVNSASAALIAPNMRSKARFLNLFDIVAWMEKIHSVWDKLPTAQQQQLHCIAEHQGLITELIEITKMIKAISRELKNNGISAQTQMRVGHIIGSHAGRQENIITFGEQIMAYLSESRQRLPNEQVIYCCSDVIESMFGKFKNRSNQGTSKGISDDMIVMSLFGKQVSKPEIRTAMEEVTLKNIEQWVKDNTIPSFAKTKNQFWRNLGPKNP